jgi:hypothetical protein
VSNSTDIRCTLHLPLQWQHPAKLQRSLTLLTLTLALSGYFQEGGREGAGEKSWGLNSESRGSHVPFRLIFSLFFDTVLH